MSGCLWATELHQSTALKYSTLARDGLNQILKYNILDMWLIVKICSLCPDDYSKSLCIDGNPLQVSYIEDCNPSLVVFYQCLSSIDGRISSTVNFHQGLTSIKGCLPSKGVFHWWWSSITRLSSLNSSPTSIVKLYQRSTSIKGPLPLRVVSHWRLSPIK